MELGAAQQATPPTPPAVPQQIVSVDVIGHLTNPDGDVAEIKYELQFPIPKEIRPTDERVNLAVFAHLAQQPGIIVKNGDESSLYPLSSFTKITVRPRTIVGVTLA